MMIEKAIAAFLHVGAAFLYVVAGDIGGDAVLLLAPAAISQVAGTVLWARANRQLAPAPPAPVVENRQLAQVQEIVAGMQDDIAKLREDREFFQRLYGSHSTAPDPASTQRSQP